MKTRTHFIRTLIGAGAAASAPGRLAAAPVAAPMSDIVVDAPNLFPENIAFLASTQRFYVGSLRYGRISSIGFDGTIATVVDDPRLHSTFGIVADETSGTIVACNADIGLSVRSTPADAGRICSVVTIDAHAGKIVRTVDLIAALPGKHLPNDVAIAADGSMYVTDSLAPIVFRVAPEGTSHVFASDPQFAPPESPGGGMDGIAIAPSGTIVANHIAHGTFFRIDPATKAVTRVRLPGDATFAGCDGMRFENGRLIVAQSRLGGTAADDAILTLDSGDDWRSATVASRTPTQRTTYQTVRTPRGVFGVQSSLEKLFADPKTADVARFTIAHISLS